MKKGLFRVMTLFLVLGTMFMPVLAEDEASGSEGASTVNNNECVIPEGKYLGYSKLEYDLHTMNYIFDGNEERVAYCMNANVATPVPIINADASYSLFTNLHDYMIYSKGDDSTINANVKRVLYYGYPINGEATFKTETQIDSVNPASEIQQTLMEHFGLSALQCRIATQAAVWKYTDGLEYDASMFKILEKIGGGSITAEIQSAYNTENVKKAYEMLINETLLPAVENVQLEYFKNDSLCAQDLLAARISSEETFNPSLFSVSIHAEKYLDNQEPSEGDKFDFVLKNGEQVIQKVQNNGSSIDFTFCQYTNDVITYTLQESAGTDSNIMYDSAAYKITVSFNAETGEAVVKYPETGTPKFYNTTKHEENSPEKTDHDEPEQTPAPSVEPTPESTPSPAPSSTPVPVKEETPVIEQNSVVSARPYTPNTGDEMEIMKWGRALAASLALGMLNGVILKKYH